MSFDPRKHPQYAEFLREQVVRDTAKEDAAKIRADRAAGVWGGFEDAFDAPPTPDPDRLQVTGRGPIIPSKTVSLLSGPRKSGKTWAAAAWSAQEIRGGHSPVWVDFERQKGLLRDKMTALGIKPHLGPQLRYTATLPPLDAMLERAAGALVVFDSWRGLQARVVPGSSANDGDAVEQVYREYLDHLIAAGATISILDHLTKDGKGGTFGSERKESQADLVINVESGRTFTKTQPGYCTLTWSADRYGNAEAGTVAAYLWHPGDGSLSGASDQDYPEVPELRSWSPVKASLSAFVDQPQTRDGAVVEIVSGNSLVFGLRPLAAAVVSKYPDLFAGKDPSKLAQNHIAKMAKDGKLTKDSAGAYDVPSSAVVVDLVARLNTPAGA